MWLQIQAEGASRTQQSWSEGDLWNPEGRQVQAALPGTALTDVIVCFATWPLPNMLLMVSSPEKCICSIATPLGQAFPPLLQCVGALHHNVLLVQKVSPSKAHFDSNFAALAYICHVYQPVRAFWVRHFMSISKGSILPPSQHEPDSKRGNKVIVLSESMSPSHVYIEQMQFSG